MPTMAVVGTATLTMHPIAMRMVMAIAMTADMDIATVVDIPNLESMPTAMMENMATAMTRMGDIATATATMVNMGIATPTAGMATVTAKVVMVMAMGTPTIMVDMGIPTARHATFRCSQYTLSTPGHRSHLLLRNCTSQTLFATCAAKLLYRPAEILLVLASVSILHCCLTGFRLEKLDYVMATKCQLWNCSCLLSRHLRMVLQVFGP